VHVLDEPLPRWVRVADALALTAFVIAALIILTGGLDRTEVVGIRVSVNRPDRAFLLGCAILAWRHYRERRHPRLSRMWRRWVGPGADLTERSLFPSWSRHSVHELALVCIAFTALVSVVTWPQVRDVNGVPDYGDPLFSIWRLTWIAHQLARNPSELFHGNMFHPEQLTLTYSDSVLLQGTLAAPFLWMGVDPLRVYTYVFLSGWIFSGVTMYYLCRALTGHRGAAAVAGTIFAIYPYRFEHYSHLEQVTTIFEPLTLLFLHRAIARGRWRDGLATGVSYAAQMYSCMYAALFLAVFMMPLALVLWIRRQRPWAPVRSLALGAGVAAVLIAPLAMQYAANRPTLGERDTEEIRSYSALPADYLDPHPRLRWYSPLAANGHPERQAFPGLAVLVLAAIGLRRPWGTARLAYVIAGLVACHASLGMNGIPYPVPHQFIGAFRGLRVPARFSILVGLTLSVTAAYAVSVLVTRWPSRARLIVLLVLVIVVLDLYPRLELRPLWERPPSIYSVIPPEPPSVVADLPISGREQRDYYSSHYLYFSTFHWHRILDGNSGFHPPSWHEYSRRMDRFPGDEALSYLRSRGVQYLAIHGGFYDDPADFEAVQHFLARKADVERVAVARFAGSLSELYRLD
jgi:hypothetical protein